MKQVCHYRILQGTWQVIFFRDISKCRNDTNMGGFNHYFNPQILKNKYKTCLVFI